MRSLYYCLLVSVCLACAACGTRQAVLYTPRVVAPETTRQGAFGAVDMRAAIVQACEKLGWKVEEAWPGTLEASMNMGERHVARVAIAYNAHYCTIHYRDSTSMAHTSRSDGSALIHPAYNQWVKKLEKEIEQNIPRQLQARTTRPTAPAVPENPLAMDLPDPVRRAVEVEEARMALSKQPPQDLVMPVPQDAAATQAAGAAAKTESPGAATVAPPAGYTPPPLPTSGVQPAAVPREAAATPAAAPAQSAQPRQTDVPEPARSEPAPQPAAPSPALAPAAPPHERGSKASGAVPPASTQERERAQEAEKLGNARQHKAQKQAATPQSAPAQGPSTEFRSPVSPPAPSATPPAEASPVPAPKPDAS